MKLAGKCWATSTGQGKSGGSCGNTISSAAGPPVEVPISTSPGSGPFPGLISRGRSWHPSSGAHGPDGIATPALRRGSDDERARSAAGSAGSGRWRRPAPFPPAPAADGQSPEKPSHPAWRQNRRHRVRSLPASLRRLPAVSEDIITTGRGASIMIRLRQVSPSMPGI